MFRKIGGIVSVIIWMAMMGFLYQREVRPAMEATQAPGYKDYFKKGMGERTRMGIYQGSQRIGFSETSVSQITEGAAQIAHETQVEWNVLGRSVPLRFFFIVNLDGEYDFEDFSLTLVSGLSKATMKGFLEKDKLHYTFEGLGTQRKGKLDFNPQELMVSSLTSFSPTHKLWVGKKWKVRMLNPMLLKMENVEMTVTEKTKTIYDGEVIDVYKVIMNLPGSRESVYSLIDTRGRLIEQKTPLGWRLVREPIKGEGND